MDSGLSPGVQTKHRRPTSLERQGSPAGAFANAPDHGAHVLSVSARDAPGAPAAPAALVVSDDSRSAAARPARPRDNDIFLTPRVIDRSAFDDLTTSLRALIAEANAASAALKQTMTLASQTDRQTAASSSQLQERLSLGARMLKAFQTQIDHAQSAAMTSRAAGPDKAEPPERRTAELSQQINARIEAALTTMHERINQSIDDALARFEQAMGERSSSARGVDNAIAETAARAEALVKTVESAEVNIASLAHNAAQSVVKVQFDAQQAGELIEKAKLSRLQLAQSLQETTRRIDDAADRVERIDRLTHEVRGRFDQQMRELAEAMRDVSMRMDTALAAGPGAEDEPGDRTAGEPVASLVDVKLTGSPGTIPAATRVLPFKIQGRAGGA